MAEKRCPICERSIDLDARLCPVCAGFLGDDWGEIGVVPKTVPYNEEG